MPEEPLGISLREQVGAVGQRERQSVGALGGEQREIELRRARIDAERGALHVAEHERRGLGILHREHDVERRRAAHAAVRVAQLQRESLERNLLMIEPRRDALAQPAKQLGERRIAVEVAALDHGVVHVAHHACQLRLGAARDAGADEHARAPSVAVQHRHVRGEQHEVSRRSASPRERVDRLAQRERKQLRLARAGEAWRGRSGKVRRQVERIERTLELTAPEREQLVQPSAREPLALPGREVGVLDGQWRERALGTAARGDVRLAHLAKEHTERPAVHHDVMRLQHQHVLGIAEAQERDAEEMLVRHVERRASPSAHGTLGFALALLGGERGEIDDVQHDRRRRIDQLDGRAVRVSCGEPGAERLVARDERVERATQCDDVERAGETPRDRHVVRGRGEIGE